MTRKILYRMHFFNFEWKLPPLLKILGNTLECFFCCSLSNFFSTYYVVLFIETVDREMWIRTNYFNYCTAIHKLQFSLKYEIFINERFLKILSYYTSTHTTCINKRYFSRYFSYYRIGYSKSCFSKILYIA